jgi:hypothetical protein
MPPDFDEAVFFPAFADAGMTAQAIVNGGDPKEVLFLQPDERVATSVQSRQYEMEYQTSDFPELAEDDEVEINGTQYRVREAAFVDGMMQGSAPTGFFSKALLTKVA